MGCLDDGGESAHWAAYSKPPAQTTADAKPCCCRESNAVRSHALQGLRRRRSRFSKSSSRAFPTTADARRTRTPALPGGYRARQPPRSLASEIENLYICVYRARRAAASALCCFAYASVACVRNKRSLHPNPRKKKNACKFKNP